MQRPTAHDPEPQAARGTPPEGIRALCERIWDAEREEGLLDRELRGIRVWQVLRYRTFQRLASKAALFGAAAPASPTGPAAQLEHLLRLATGSVTHNPLVGRERVDALVLEPGRVRTVDGRRVNIHTHFLLQELERQGKTVQVLASRFGGRHRKSPDPRRRYADVIDLAGWFAQRIPRARLGDAERRQVRDMQRALSSHVGLEVDLMAPCQSLVRSFWVAHGLYSRLLRRRRPSETYCICAYGGLAPFVKASRDAGVPVTELQHGVITRYHLGYSFPVLPSSGKLEYFPDRLLTWGEPWDRWMDLPELITEVEPFGFRFFEHQRKAYEDVATRPGKVVVLSQGVLGPRIAELLLQHFDALRDLQIVFKLHPTEYQRWQNEPSMRALAERPNVEMATDVDLYQLLSEAEYQIGVFSTALYEGLALGCKAVLLPLPGIESMDAVIASGDAIGFEEFLAGRRGRG
ncbi:MAG: hypothetical protein PVI30_10835 [Myxococcales bacterium]